MTEYSTRGQHITADFWGIAPELLDDLEQLKEWMVEAIELAGATVLNECSHKFNPQGATALLLLSESHMSIHTYPEKGFAALDCYTCGARVDPIVAIAYMRVLLGPKKSIFREFERGIDPNE